MNNRVKLVVIATLLTGAGSASASLVDAIAGLMPGEHYRVLFATSTKVQALSADIDFYNSIVNNSAINGKVTGLLGLGNWRAIISTTSVDAHVNARAPNSDFSPTKIFNAAGELLATSAADLWDGRNEPGLGLQGGLLTPVRYTEDGVRVPSGDGAGLDPAVWTGSHADGTRYADMPGITGPVGGISGAPRMGDTGSSNMWWVDGGGGGGALRLRLFGLSPVATRGVTVLPGESPENPVMPIDPGNGTGRGPGIIKIRVSPGVTTYVDPLVAIGFDYESHDPTMKFMSVSVPLVYGDGIFSLYLFDESLSKYIDSGARLNTGETFSFGALGYSDGVLRFGIRGIDPAANVDPANPTGFVTGLTFSREGLADFEMKATVVPAPSAGLLLTSAMACLGWHQRRKGDSASSAGEKRRNG